MTGIVGWLLSVALVLALPQGQVRTVLLPEPAPAGVCRLADSGVPAVRERSGVVVSCGSAGLLMCDFEGMEPLDVDVTALCRTGRLSLTPAVAVPLPNDSDWSDVEWLDWPEGTSPAVVAMRPRSALTHLALGTEAPRFLRFRRPGFAPVTLPRSAIQRNAGWGLPAPVNGGELLVTFAAARVSPVAVRVLDAAGASIGDHTLVDDWGRLVVGGVPEGKLTWQPLYEGGIAGPSAQVEIVAEQSTSLVLAPQDVGQIRIHLAPELCTNAGTIEVTRLGESPSGRATRSRVSSGDLSFRCDRVIAGLRPAEYEVRARGASAGFSVLASVRVDAQSEASVNLELPPVSVSGTVTLNGKPYPRSGLVLTFLEPEESPMAGVAATVFAAGSYSARLPRPGTYTARLDAGQPPFPLLSSVKTVEIVEGANLLDWELEGGNLTVDVEGWDQSSVVAVVFCRLSTANGSGGRAPYVLTPPSESRVLLHGLLEGTYRLQARQERPDKTVLVSSPQEVTVAIDRDAEVSLRLETYAAEITVVDPSGQPVSTAVLQAAYGPLPQTASGVFQATARTTSPGDEIQIRAPEFLATCQRAPPSGQDVLVRLTPGFSTTVEVRSTVPFGVLPGAFSWPGSQCRIGLQSLAATSIGVTTEPDGTVVSTFAVTQLPSADQLTYIPLPNVPASRLVRDDRGVIVITIVQ